MSAVSLTRDGRVEQKKILFVESETLTEGPWAPCQDEAKTTGLL